MDKEYFTIMLDKRDFITLEAVFAEKKAHLRDWNSDSEFYQRISRILDEVRNKLGWED